jgi:uncharacterized protein (TIGR03435 family)
MSFDVASVKRSTNDEDTYTNFPFDGDAYSPGGGLLSATNLSLGAYIRFAYKLPIDQYERLNAELPKWAFTEFFDVQAQAAGNPTKDQMRLMMQSLLADRFELVVRYETRQIPVFALMLEKPGKTGPQLQPHPDTMACADPKAGTPKYLEEVPPICGVLLRSREVPTGEVRLGMRKVSVEALASLLGTVGRLGRPVLNQTGLSGTFDFTMEWEPEPQPGSDLQADPSAPTFLEALKDQLGLKLDSTTGPVSIFVIDHIEQPSPN